MSKKKWINPIVANLKYQSEAHNLTYNLYRGQTEAPDNGIKAWSIRPGVLEGSQRISGYGSL